MVAVLAALRYGALFVGATEGDVPPATAVRLPAGSELVDDDVECGSGGCWRLLTVRPPEGTSVHELSAALGTTPLHRIRGTLWDPRTIRVTSVADEGFLVVHADYWS